MKIQRLKWVVRWFVGVGMLLGLGVLVSPAAAQDPCGATYTVVYRDTLRQIAERCDTSMAALLQANPAVRNPNLIYPGQQLIIPTSDDDGDGRTTYTVQRGDWLARIARRFETTVDAILRANPGLRNPDLIYPGQRLVIPLDERQAGPEVEISPARGAPGTAVQVVGYDLPPDRAVVIGIGVQASEYSETRDDRTDSNGRLRTTVRIPDYAEPGERWVVVIDVPDSRIKEASNPFLVTGDQADGPVFERTTIYLIALEDGGERGEEIGCNDSLVPVEVAIEPTQAPLTAALTELVSLESEYYGQSGLYNALHRSALQVDAVRIEGGEAVIELSGEVQLGGVCDTPRFKAQLEETALQYETVERATITINGRPLESF